MKFIKSALPMFLALGTIAGCSSTSSVSVNEDTVKSEEVSPEIARLIQGCDSNDADSCFDLGVRYDDGQGVKQDYSKATTYYEKACSMNDGDGCFISGLYYSQGKGVKQDYSKASTLYEKACNLNDGVGCSNLGYLYDNGQGVKRDYRKANAYYEKACDMNDGLGCRNLGVLYRDSKGVKHLFRKSLQPERRRRVCQLRKCIRRWQRRKTRLHQS